MDLLRTGNGEGERIRVPGFGIDMRVLVPAAATGGQLCMVEELTAAGSGPPLHVHTRQTEIFRFLEGSYEVEVDGRRLAVETGDVVIVPPGARHTFRNVGRTMARLSFILTPAGSGEQFFREMAALLAAGGPPDPQALQALGRRHDTEFVGPPLGATGHGH
jgi:mannose-6-phosphate isomerase-like protein (cupin superfamily)